MYGSGIFERKSRTLFSSMFRRPEIESALDERVHIISLDAKSSGGKESGP